jgi:1,4-alpha-glucan branching enzyme
MSEKGLSGEEKRQKMKEEFKKELRERKEFLEKVKRLRQTQRINKALSDMSVEDDTDDWINKLNQETAFMDAKNELVMDSGKVVNVPIEGLDDDVSPEPAVEPEPIASEEELRKIAAEELVRKMKEEMAAESGLAVTATTSESEFRERPVKPLAGEKPAEDEETENKDDDDSGSDRPFRKMMDDIK